jgi:hypothetical protein
VREALGTRSLTVCSWCTGVPYVWDPGEAFRCGLLWTGTRPLCAHLADILGGENSSGGGGGGGGNGVRDSDVWAPRRVLELGAGMGVVEPDKYCSPRNFNPELDGVL